MTNLRLTLKSSETLEFTNFINGLFIKCFRNMNVIDYYNLRHFYKQLHDRNYKYQSFSNKMGKHNVPVNINVYATLDRFYNLNRLEIEQPSNVFYFIIYKDILMQLHKQLQSITALNNSLHG